MKQLWYLSFATDDQFVGACIVEADGLLDAVHESILLGCNGGPDTGVLGMPVPEQQVARAREHMNVLMSLAQMTAWGMEAQPYSYDD